MERYEEKIRGSADSVVLTEDEGMRMPVVALRGMTILPGMVIHFDLSRKKSILAVERAMGEDQRIFLVTQRDAEEEDPGYDGVYRMGSIAQIKQVTRLPENVVRVLVEGLWRGRLKGLDEEAEYLCGDVEKVESPVSLADSRGEETGTVAADRRRGGRAVRTGADSAGIPAPALRRSCRAAGRRTRPGLL